MRRRTGQGGYVMRKGGFWVGRYYADLPDGQTRTRKAVRLGLIKGLSKSEAKRKLRTFLEESGVNDVVVPTSPAGKTFKEHYEWWEQNKLVLAKESYQERISFMTNTHLLPYFGDTLLASITEEKVQEFISHLSRTTYKTPAGITHPLSAVYVRDLVSILKRIIGKEAAHWELTLPSIPFKEQRYFTPSEMLQIINAAAGKWKVLFALLAETGLRCGEAFGLHIEDLNLKARQLTVRRSIYKGRECSPKTRRGYRTVDISLELCHLLKQHVNGRTQGYVFTTRNATPLGRENSRRMLHAILDRLNIPKGGLHAFRHGRVSILQAAGVPADLIKQWVGHSSLKTTSRYTHFGQEFAQNEAARNGLLSRANFLNGPHGPQISQKSESWQQSQATGT